MAHIVFFDGVCNLCNKSVDFILKRDHKLKFRYASLQSDFAIKLLGDKGVDTSSMRTIILLKDQKVFFKSDAVLEIARDLRAPWPALYIFKLVPRFIRDGLYNLISKNRYNWFGKRDTCRVPTDEEKKLFLEGKENASSVNPKRQIGSAH
jgi:predicted DCC family thiol-disulfide oxidoreductase YuxK